MISESVRGPYLCHSYLLYPCLSMFILVSDSVPDFPLVSQGSVKTHSPVPGPWTSCGRTFLTHALSEEHRQKAESWHDVWWHPLISCIHYIRVWYVDRTMILLLHTVAIGFHMLSPQHQKSSNGQLRKGVLDFLTFLRSSLRRETLALQPGFADRICEMKFFKHWRPCK